MNVQLLPFSRRSSLLQDAVGVYTRVWSRNTADSLIFFRKYAEYQHFHGYVAVVRSRVVGMAFGTESVPGMWWHDKVAQQVGQDHPALQSAWVLTELAVLEGYRNGGVGARLLRRVLAEQPFPNALLSTQQHNRAAQRFYQRHGWDYLHPGFAFHRGHDPYVIMHHVQPT